MNILITGGTGFIGQALIKSLLVHYQNLNIVLISRAPLAYTGEGKQLLGSNLHVLDAIDNQLIEQQDIVINLAGEPIANKRWSKSQKESICQSRYQITEKLSNLINNAVNPPKLFISGSAIGFYGRQGAQAVDEDCSSPFDEFSHQLCQKWEELALAASTENTRVCLLRTGIVLGENHGALAKMLLPFKLGVGATFASGEQFMSWVHITDMVQAIIYIIENPNLHGAINMTAPNAVSNQEFSKTLAQVLSRPCLFNTPEFMLKIMFGEMADLFIYGQNVRPTKLINSGFAFQYPHLTPALNNILKQEHKA